MTAARRMAGALKDVAVLIVEDDEDTRDLLQLGLAAVGAEVRTAASAEAGLAALETYRPDAVLCDLQLPGVDGYGFLALVRGNPRLRDIPVVALSGVPEAQRPSARDGFEKHLVKPTRLPDIVVALVSVTSGAGRAPTAAARVSAELRDILARLNAATDCQFTSLLRFADDGTLVSIWTYDRDNPRIDPFPLGLPLHASYCVLIRDQDQPYATGDSAADAALAGKLPAARARLACYVGAPVYRADRSMFGTVCCYDSEPRPAPVATRDAVAAAARQVEPLLVELFDR